MSFLERGGGQKNEYRRICSISSLCAEIIYYENWPLFAVDLQIEASSDSFMDFRQQRSVFACLRRK